MYNVYTFFYYLVLSGKVNLSISNLTFIEYQPGIKNIKIWKI